MSDEYTDEHLAPLRITATVRTTARRYEARSLYLDNDSEAERELLRNLDTEAEIQAMEYEWSDAWRD